MPTLKVSVLIRSRGPQYFCAICFLSFRFCSFPEKIFAFFSRKRANKFNIMQAPPPGHPPPSFPSQCLVSRCLDKRLTTVSSRPDNQWQMPVAKSNYFCLMCCWRMEALREGKKSKSKTVFFQGHFLSEPFAFFSLLFLKM